MAYTIVMPRLGWTMEEGVFGAWLKADGERVTPGDLLFTVEGDKAIQEVETFESGILRIPPDAPQPGDVVVVGAVLGYLVQEGEELPFAAPQSQGAAAPQGAGSVTDTEGSTPVRAQAAAVAANGSGAMPAISPRARRVAAELGIDWTQLQGSGRTGRIVERDVRAAAQAAVTQAAEIRSAGAVRATPVAQRVAQDAGINLAAVSPTGPGARIQRSDVEAAIRAQQAPTAPTSAPAPAAAPVLSTGDYDVVPVSRVRRLIAQRMVGSAHDTAPVTLTTEADATALVALRDQLRGALEPRGRLVPSYNDMLIKLTAVALQQHGALNATWQEETILQWRTVHMGLAVDVEDGLVVPVVRDAQARSVGQIAAATRDLITRAQAHQLWQEEMQGATFTITNLGMFGIDAFTPIINLPQAAILGVGRIMARPWVVDNQVVPRKLMALSLTFDHRVADGAAAARFLNLVREYVEEPSLWMFE
jgi:pyruvate dehydrogenase E2 component (dihydrolipoamide acetyltransferase)